MDLGEPKTTDYCTVCGQSPDSGVHWLPNAAWNGGHPYVDPRIRASADIVAGKTTNRVKLRGKRGAPRKQRSKPTSRSPQRALANYRKDPSTAGRVYTVISISLPVDDLALIDELASQKNMARSDLLRTAALALIPEEP